ncbi:hypothetical protein [Rodentibacter pneumotropicus]|uniref:hypothetical protein n=1 Tax=Rodentibacter pneumotropicus TaxID=758 RepID=UPI00109BF669|nr:hypothetical protein [Rodentibacter pneumotropicus]THA03943.1 hypothetical protein D3M73_10850 [Rodentibacter pneumotropicus]
MSTTLKVLSAKKVIASHQINQGDTLVIDARDKSNYQLIDDQTGFGPQNIIAKREGKDLKIFLEDGDMNPDVLIKGYYGDENSEEVTNLIVGQHENGGIYAYVPESGLKSDAVSMLAEEVAAPQALGGEELASAFWAFNPWWLLALVPLAAGIAIAASSGGSNGDSNNGNADNTADKPTLDAKSDGSVTVAPGADNTKVVVKYTDESGNKKAATLTKDANGNWSSDNPDVTPNANGTFSIPANKVKDGSKVTATGTDDKGNTANVDATAANNPTTSRVPGDVDGNGNADANDNDATTENGGPKVSVPEAADGVNKTEASDGVQVNVTLPKNTKAGDTVTVTVTKPDGSTVTVDHVVTDADETAGKAAVTIPTTEITADGDYKVVAKVTTPDGQESKPSAEVPFTFDQTPPATPDVQAPADGSITVEPKDENPVTIKYTDENGNEKEFTVKKDDNGNWVSDDKPANVSIDSNTGKTTIPATEVKDGEKVTATAKDPAGNTAEKTADAGNNPTTPRVPGDVDGDGDADANDNDATTENGGPKVSVPEAADGVNKTEASDGVQVNVTLPKNTKAGDTVTLTVTKPDGSTVTVDHVVTDADETAGKAAVTIPTTEITADGDYKVVAKVTTPDGQESKPSAEVPFTFDQTPPATPDVQAPADGSMTVEPKDENPVTIKYTDENGNEKEFTVKKDDNDNWVSDDKPANVSIDPNTGKTTIPATEVKDGEKVTATAKDPAGNTAEKTADAGNNPTTPRIPGDVDGDGDADADDNDATTEKGGPKVTIPEAENSVNAEEAKDGVQVDVTLPKNTKEGDTVKLSVIKPNGQQFEIDYTVNKADETSNKATVTIPALDVGIDGNYDVAARVVTPDGQESRVSDSVPFTVDNGADQPTITSANNDGKVIVEPGEDNNKVEIKFKDEDGNDKTVVAEKGADGNWTVTADDGTGATIENGKVLIPSDKVKDGEPVNATGTDASGNTADADTVNAGTNPTVNNTADKPLITPENDGSVTVKPGDDNVGVVVDFKDEKNQPQQVSAKKDDNGKWIISNNSGVDGAEVDPDTGIITIPAEALKDNEPVNAVGFDEIFNRANADPKNAGTDPKNAGVDNTNGDGVVSAPVSADEGTSIVTTVKLNNNNGNEKLPFSLPSGTGNGQLTADDFEQPTFSNGVTLNSDGTLNIPAGVKEFTITTPVKADNTTEGEEKGKFTVGGVEGNEVTVNDTSATPADPADKPTITSPDNDGKVTVEPGADNNKVEVTFKDEDGNDKTVVAEKGQDGNWTITNDDGTGATIEGGKVVIPADKVKDGEPVNAKGTNDAGNSENADAVNAGTDPKDAGVDNTNGDGVVSAPVSADEGTSIVTTVKLNNNNGNEKLPFSLPSGTGNGQLTADDFEQPTFSNGVTLNSDGTLNIPAGVKEFTITTPVKADNTTEGEEKGKFTVGGVEGNEVTVNDTSKQDEQPKIDINNIAGQAQVAEGTEGYAQFLPSNIATEEISNTTENGVTKVVKGFVVKGTTTSIPADSEVDVTITANGENYFTGKAKVGADGAWEIKVPTSTVTTTVTGSGEDEVTEVVTEFNNPKFDVSYDVTAKVTVNGQEITDTDKTESAPVVTDIYLQDNLTDDAQNVADFYTDNGEYVGRIDGMADSDATKAISRQTGLTNDPSAELHFTLDKEPKAGQVVKVLRYTIVDGNGGRVEDLTDQMTNNGLNYTVKPTTPQAETTNTLYRYKVVVEDQNGTDLSEKVFNYRLDTIVESMDVKELNSDTNTMVLKADGVSEIGATIKYKYHTGSGESALKDAVDNGDGTYTIDLANWNRKVPQSITLQVIDAAGNVSETKINAVRNLFTSYTAEEGPDPNGTRFDRQLVTGFAQSSTRAENGAFVSTDGNDTLIVGLDNFGGMGVSNGSVGRNINVGSKIHIEMGKGDDHIQVRGSVQSMGSATDGYFDMGEGNDKLAFSETFVVGNYNIRMGEGNNTINFSGTTVQAAGLDISYGDGNDVLRADVNKDFAGTKTISFGNGDNYMEVGSMYDKNTITFGNGNDVFIAKSVGTKAPSSGVIDMGDGNDTFSVSGLFARQEAKLGAGDDVAIMGDRIETGAAWARLDGGDGNDTLVLTKSDGKVSLQNVLNFEVIDLTTPTAQTIGISNSYITQANDTTKAIYIKGGTNDTVDFGDNGKYINGTKFKDGGGAIKSNWNFWEKTESDVVHDGITYDKYTYRTASGEVNDEAIYIQQGVQII